MTTIKPDSMSPGGSENEQTLTPINNSSSTNEVSFSHSISPEKVSFKRVRSGQVTIIATRRNWDFHPVLRPDKDPYITLTIENSDDLLKTIYYDTWRHRAVSRFLQIWGVIDTNLLKRGLHATRKFLQTYSGVISSAYGRGYITRREQSSPWTIVDKKYFNHYSQHSYINPLSDEGVKAAKVYARLLRQSKQELNPDDIEK